MKLNLVRFGELFPEKRYWFRLVCCLRHSVIPAILPRVLFCSLFSIFISWLDFYKFPVSLPLDNLIPSLVLGLLLVFRTNTAYERFWEGRKQWGVLINTVRNFARQIWVTIQEKTPQDRTEKITTIRLLVAFSIATKQHLRQEFISQELEPLISPVRLNQLKSMNNPPLEVAFWIGDYLQQQADQKRINPYQLAAMFKLLDSMVDALGACERILKTPIPLAYSIHLKQLLLLYCLSLPFQWVEEFGFITFIVVGLVSFTVFGVEEIGIEIENPFGYDANDLPLDQICKTMQTNIEDLITLAPAVCHWQEIERQQ